MLSLTERGFRRSVSEHNCDNEIVSDWIIANVLLCEDGEMSKTDLIDVLHEQEIYSDDNPDYCAEYVNMVWDQTCNQINLLGNTAPVFFEGRVIKRAVGWNESPVFTFFIILYLKKFFSGWSDEFNGDHGDQGELFEKVCACAIQQQFQDYKVMISGWSKNNAATFLNVAEQVATFVSEDICPENINLFVSKNAKDLGLDILWVKEFADARGGNITTLAQCASGHDLKDKIKTPDMAIWGKVIRWKSPPQKAFMTPFALPEMLFNQLSASSEGIMFDRYRILVANKTESEWVDIELKNSLIKWLSPKIEWLQAQTL